MGENASDAAGARPGAEGGDEHIPFMQQVLDHPFLLLFLGITVPTVFFIIWGVMEVVTIPIAQ